MELLRVVANTDPITVRYPMLSPAQKKKKQGVNNTRKEWSKSAKRKDNKQQQATTSNNKQQQATTSNNKQQQATTSNNRYHTTK
jgi:hypothetical protein